MFFLKNSVAKPGSIFWGLSKIMRRVGDRVIYLYENPILHRTVELMATIITHYENGEYKIELDNGEIIDNVDWIQIITYKPK